MVEDDLSVGEKVNKINELPLIVGHRGASAEAPENTLAAFRRAVEVGAEGIEFDIRLSKDGVPVVIHDETLVRTSKLNALVKELTAKELGQVDVGSWFDGRFSGEKVPTLEMVLQCLQGFTGPLYVELKFSDVEAEELAGAVCEVIGGSPLLPQMIVKSFRLSILPYVRCRCEGVKTAALFAPKVMRFLRKEKYLVKIAQELGADHLSLHRSLVTRKLMKKVENTGLPVTVWTADSRRWVKKGIELGLAAIITNDPAKMLAVRREIVRKCS